MLDVALAVSNASKYNLDVAQLFAMKLVDCYCTPLCLALAHCVLAAMITLNESIALPLQRSVKVQLVALCAPQHLNSLLQEALAAMVSKQLHRIIILNPEDDNKPVGVVRCVPRRHPKLIVRYDTARWTSFASWFTTPTSSMHLCTLSTLTTS